MNDAANVSGESELMSSCSLERAVRPNNKGCMVKDEDARTEALTKISLQVRLAYFDNLRSFRKIGKGRECWWEIGRYSVSCFNDENAAFDAKSKERMGSIIIGIQPHRNPLCNGLSIVFHDETSRVKLGRILLRNASSRRPGKSECQLEPIYHSSLVGMEVSKTRRGEGLSKIFVAIWLHICLKTNTYPRAAVMNKPLISCVLMGFNFVPQNGGSRVGLIRLKNGNNTDESNTRIALYSPSDKSLNGLFSQRARRMQNIAILDHPPSPASGQSGTIIYVKTGFEHPIAILENAVEYSPPHPCANDNKLFIDERTLCEIVPLGLYQQNDQKQQTSTSQSIIQRKLLADQIDSILKTNVPANGELEYFANLSSLEGAFLSCERPLVSSDINCGVTSADDLSQQEESKQSNDRKRTYSEITSC